MSNKSKEILTEDDFYAYFKPFSIWLVKKKHKKFETLSASKSRKSFRKFIKKWNSGRLKPIFYDIDGLLAKYSHLIQTNHDWNFKLSNKDAIILNNTLSEVQDFNKFSSENISKNINENIAENPKKRVLGPSFEGFIMKNTEKEEKNMKILKEEEKIEEKRQEKRFLKKKEKRDADEMSPKKIGKDAKIEKKKLLNKALNGEKDEEFNEETYENDDKSSFAQAKKMEKFRMDKRSLKLKEKRDIITEKVQKFNELEDQKVKKLLETLGLQNKYKL